jgi:hypothetical protein
MTIDVGRSAADAASGYSAEPEPSSTVSAVPVSIPNAAAIIEALEDAAERLMLLASKASDDLSRRTNRRIATQCASVLRQLAPDRGERA